MFKSGSRLPSRCAHVCASRRYPENLTALLENLTALLLFLCQVQAPIAAQRGWDYAGGNYGDMTERSTRSVRSTRRGGEDGASMASPGGLLRGAENTPTMASIRPTYTRPDMGFGSGF